MKRIALSLLCALCLLKPVLASTYSEGYDYSYEARQARYKEQVQAEVQRKHELELEARKIEVLARLYNGYAEETNYNLSSYSEGSSIVQEVTATSTSEGGAGSLTNSPDGGNGNDTITINS